MVLHHSTMQQTCIRSVLGRVRRDPNLEVMKIIDTLLKVVKIMGQIPFKSCENHGQMPF
jgi:hypothetical protein